MYPHAECRKSFGRSGREMLPVSIVHPAVLLAEMELTQTTQEPTKPPVLSHPYFQGSP